MRLDVAPSVHIRPASFLAPSHRQNKNYHPHVVDLPDDMEADSTKDAPGMP